MADTKTYTSNYNLEKPGQDDFYDVAIFNANADKIDTELKAAADRDTTHKTAATLDHPDNSVTDAKIGNRTVNQALASPGNTGTLTQMLSWITGRLKAMTGKTNWYDAPATTLEAAKAHADTAAPHSGHETPAGAQEKATAAQTAANTYTDTKTANLVNTSDTRLTNARPANGGTSTYTEYVNNDNTSMRFHWSGQPGQPGWLWGGSAPENMYVYNPANFNVNYANSAGSVPWSGVIGAPGGANGIDYVIAQVLGVNGYTKWASGKLEQWGVTGSTPGSTARTITLPQPYTTNTYVVNPVTSGGGSANIGYNFFQITAQTTTTFTAKAQASENTVMSWHAVGY